MLPRLVLVVRQLAVASVFTISAQPDSLPDRLAPAEVAGILIVGTAIGLLCVFFLVAVARWFVRHHYFGL